MGELPATFWLILLPVLLGMNSFFAAAEVALVSVRPTRMRQLAEAGDFRARAALRLLENPDRFLSAVQLGVTLASLGLGWAGEDTVYRWIVALIPPGSFASSERILHLAAFAVAFLIITFLHMVVGEVVPKNLALERSERLALGMAPALEVFARATDFFVRIVEGSSRGLSRLLGLRAVQASTGHSLEELKLIVSASRRLGHLAPPQEEMLRRAMAFFDLTARQVMVPRHEINSISAEATLEEVIRELAARQRSRLPVYDGSPERIIGIVQARDVWPLWQDRARSALAGRPPWDVRARALARPHRVVPETKPLHQLLAEFQQSRSRMALVVDEFGTIAGLVTMEDVVEQIAGEIHDEHETPAQVLPAGAPAEIDGITSILDLENLCDLRLPAGAGFETLAGFLLEKLGAIPRGGEQVEHGGRRFTVLGMAGNRIARVRVERIAEASDATVQAG